MYVYYVYNLHGATIRKRIGMLSSPVRALVEPEGGNDPNYPTSLTGPLPNYGELPAGSTSPRIVARSWALARRRTTST